MGNIEHLIPSALTVLAGLYLLALGSGVKFLWPKFLRGSAFCIILSFFVLLWGGTSLKFALTPPKFPATILVEKMRAEMSPPTLLDANLRLDDITAEKNTVVYTMTLLPSAGDIKNIADSAKDAVKESACNNADYKDTLKFADSIRMVFNDSNGAPIETLTISTQDCAQ